MKKILIINGPNLNMLGKRSKKHYGSLTLKDINKLIKNTFPKISFKFRQSNCEGRLITYIQKAFKYDALVINAASYTHTSIGIRDAIEILSIPVVAVHLSDISNRESFRQTDYLKDIVNKTFMGEKEKSYLDAITYIVANSQPNIV